MTDSNQGSAAPVGVNHLVLNVANIETAEDFWTRLMGFTRVGQLETNPNFRFYSGKVDGEITKHHDLALVQIEQPREADAPGFTMRAKQPGLNHMAITYPDRDAFLQQLAWLQANDVKFHIRMNHGMTRSAYITDPDGHGVEVLYEVPREYWEQDVNAGLNYAEILPNKGPEALEDDPEYKRFEPA